MHLSIVADRSAAVAELVTRFPNAEAFVYTTDSKHRLVDGGVLFSNPADVIRLLLQSQSDRRRSLLLSLMTRDRIAPGDVRYLHRIVAESLVGLGVVSAHKLRSTGERLVSSRRIALA